MDLLLASSSKFKTEILNKVCLYHKCINSNFDESKIKCKNPYKKVKLLALNKAKSIKEKGIIIGLDTIVLVNNKILEKPSSLEEARKYLKISSNRTVKVITGYAIINENKTINSYAVTKVKFNKISKEDIDYYLKNEKDALYVSGFVIEGMMSNYINKINGSFYNILGVPVEEIYKNLKKMGYNLNMFKKS